MKNILIALVVIIFIIGGLIITSWYTNIFPWDSEEEDNEISYVIEDERILLKNGYSEVTDSELGFRTITKSVGGEALGDLNGDGLEDLASVVVQNSEGSGSFYYLVAALNRRDGYRGMDGVFLGDRIKIESVNIVDGRVEVRFLDRKDGAPMSTEPTVEVIKYFKVDDRELKEVAK